MNESRNRIGELLENRPGTPTGKAFGYDATSNRTNAGYATGAANRITTDGVWKYTFDAEGNVPKNLQSEIRRELKKKFPLKEIEG